MDLEGTRDSTIQSRLRGSQDDHNDEPGSLTPSDSKKSHKKSFRFLGLIPDNSEDIPRLPLFVSHFGVTISTDIRTSGQT